MVYKTGLDLFLFSPSLLLSPSVILPLLSSGGQQVIEESFGPRVKKEDKVTPQETPKPLMHRDIAIVKVGQDKAMEGKWR